MFFILRRRCHRPGTATTVLYFHPPTARQATASSAESAGSNSRFKAVDGAAARLAGVLDIEDAPGLQGRCAASSLSREARRAAASPRPRAAAGRGPADTCSALLRPAARRRRRRENSESGIASRKPTAASQLGSPRTPALLRRRKAVNGTGRRPRRRGARIEPAGDLSRA